MLICKVMNVARHFSCLVHAIRKIARNGQRFDKLQVKSRVEFVYTRFKLDNKKSIQIDFHIQSYFANIET